MQLPMAPPLPPAQSPIWSSSASHQNALSMTVPRVQPNISPTCAAPATVRRKLVARQIHHDPRDGRFATTAFSHSASGLICPNGVISTTAYRSGAGDGFHYRFTATQCQGCPIWELCRKPDAKADGHRTVFISDHALLHEAELAYLDTPAAKADFSFRANVERHIAALTRHNGARRAKVRGLDKVNFQVTMAATAYNLKRWHVMTLQQERSTYEEKHTCSTTLSPPT